MVRWIRCLSFRVWILYAKFLVHIPDKSHPNCTPNGTDNTQDKFFSSLFRQTLLLILFTIRETPSTV